MKNTRKHFRLFSSAAALCLCLPLSGCVGGLFHYDSAYYTMCQVDNQDNWQFMDNSSRSRGGDYFYAGDFGPDTSAPLANVKWLYVQISMQHTPQAATYDPSTASIEVDGKKFAALPRAWLPGKYPSEKRSKDGPKEETTVPVVLHQERGSPYDSATVFLAFPIQLKEHATFRLYPGYIMQNNTEVPLPVLESCYVPGHIRMSQRGII